MFFIFNCRLYLNWLIEIFVQFHSLSSYQNDLYRNFFASKPPVSVPGVQIVERGVQMVGSELLVRGEYEGKNGGGGGVEWSFSFSSHPCLFSSSIFRSRSTILTLGTGCSFKEYCERHARVARAIRRENKGRERKDSSLFPLSARSRVLSRPARFARHSK